MLTSNGKRYCLPVVLLCYCLALAAHRCKSLSLLSPGYAALLTSLLVMV